MKTKMILVSLGIILISSCGINKDSAKIVEQNKMLSKENEALKKKNTELKNSTDFLLGRVTQLESEQNMDDMSTEDMPAEEIILNSAEEMPMYLGERTLNEIIEENLVPPSIASVSSGTVYIEFVVQENGTLSRFKTVKSLSLEHDAEAVRVIKKTSPWSPGRIDGKGVKVRMVVPVQFK